MIYLLSYSHSKYGDKRSTAFKLAEEAGWTFINQYSNVSLNPEEDILIRYGVWKRPELDKEAKLVLNKSSAIRLNCTKALAHYIMYNAGVKVPKIYFLPDKIEHFPVLSRHKYHTKAKDIKFIYRAEDLKNRDWKAFYFVEFIEGEIEYRVHILRDKCIRLSRRLPMRSFPFVDPLIRSFSKGWKLRDKTGWTHLPEIEEEAIKQSILAVKVIGLDFGAVDVIIEKSTDTPYILEVNSAPRLNQLGRKKYIKALKRLLSDGT